VQQVDAAAVGQAEVEQRTGERRAVVVVFGQRTRRARAPHPFARQAMARQGALQLGAQFQVVFHQQQMHALYFRPTRSGGR